jgi:hypothetical protein
VSTPLSDVALAADEEERAMRATLRCAGNPDRSETSDDRVLTRRSLSDAAEGRFTG